MPFLLPAVLALSSDVIVLWLSRLAPKQSIYNEDEKHLAYNVDYLAPLALIRITLLLLPLLFHSYSGTAIKCLSFYQLLYWGTLVMLFIHMLSLSFMNPESLEALIPIDFNGGRTLRELLEHLHEFRRIWWMLALSFISDVCHLIILWHVRSTAPHSAILMGGRKQPSAYYAVRSSRMRDGNGAGDEPALVHAMNDFVAEMQIRLQRAKTDWTDKLREVTANHRDDGTTVRHPSLPNILLPVTPFRVMLQLFAYEDVLENGKLDAIFEKDDGHAITFFVPQLLSFLLHGAFHSSPQLEEWILDKCRRSIHFAHRCYWFLRAWCLEVPAELPTTPGVSRTNSANHLLDLSESNSVSSQGLSPFLDEPATLQDTLGCSGRLEKLNRVSSAPRASLSDKFLPEERVMIERLMLRVKECGEEPARLLAYESKETEDEELSLGSDLENVESAEMNGSSQHGSGYLDSPAAIMEATESGLVPVDPNSGFPSVKHLDCLAAKRKFGFLPLDKDELHSPTSPNHHHSETEHFDKTPGFLDALIYLAESLFNIPRENRKEELCKQLQNLECELLPSNAVYVPVGNMDHRVWRVAAEESVVISTKERVPCIVCLEVIDYIPDRQDRRNWRFLGSLPRRTRSVGEPTSPTDSRRTAIEGFDHSEDSELEIMNEWRYGKRDPHRRSSLFDKVTTKVRHNMEDSLIKMKTQVQDRISQFHERTMSEELQALTSIECDASETSQELADVCNINDPTRRDIEEGDAGTPSVAAGSDEDLQNISRISSVGSLVSMGQWSTPPPLAKSNSEGSRPRAGSSLVGVRRRMDKDASDSGNKTLPYGSDHEEDQYSEPPPSKARRSATTGTESSEASSRRPAIVFSESWSSKVERVRKRSAYGSDPNWRLLPILVKANDDLRQEQLASQLIYRMASILAREKVSVWLCPYEIIALTDRGGIIEAIPDTISLDSLKRNDPNFTSLRVFFDSHYGEGTEELADAKSCFVESLSAYSIVCFLLQIKDRHNGNILLDNRGHLIHIDFGFFFLSSPGKNVGFESAPFKLTRDFVDLLGGPEGHLFRTFRELCVKTFIALRRHCMEIILMVEMLKNGNEELNCFRGRPDDAIQQLRERFRLDLNDRACREYVNSLVDDSVENWRTDWYDRYQRYFVGVL